MSHWFLWTKDHWHRHNSTWLLLKTTGKFKRKHRRYLSVGVSQCLQHLMHKLLLLLCRHGNLRTASWLAAPSSVSVTLGSSIKAATTGSKPGAAGRTGVSKSLSQWLLTRFKWTFPVLTRVRGREPPQPESADPVGSVAEPPWLWGSAWLTEALDPASVHYW